MSRPVVHAAIVAFTASFCTLVIELVAGRVLAPYVGVSLYTWTSIIGVVLAGISGGAYAGGWLADRRPVPSTLGWLLLAAGAASILIAPATNLLASDDGLLTSMGIATTLLQRVVLLSFVLFFLPAFFLGMISPVAVKLAVKDVATAGSVVGKIYALSTLGSIAGTFVTGFWLVARFGTRTTLVGVGVTLIIAALLFGGLFGRYGRAAAALLAVGAAAYAGLWPGALPPPHQDPLQEPSGTGIIHYEESQYYTIQVDRTIRDDTGAPLHALHLDHLVHSYADLQDPSYLEYGYLRTFQDVIEWRAKQSPVFRLLFIGGGGYTLPRLVDGLHPAAQVDVVEIDPAVTRVARRFFGVGRDAAIRSINEDARWFAMREGEPYDVIFIDAFNDLSVPYHLTTRELTARLQQRLTPDGAVVVNVIDDYRKGRFLASYIRTLQSVFGERNVAVLMDAEEDMESSRSTFVVVASRNLAGITSETAAWVLPHDRLQRYLASREAIVLTDDFAPVDNMLAPLFTERFVDEIGEE
ncbi:MAG TPA: fused MFS/spermidine synthase [Thermoanaerobaculia bacterium]|jgi:predicted membrane-bound spermidine synthase